MKTREVLDFAVNPWLGWMEQVAELKVKNIIISDATGYDMKNPSDVSKLILSPDRYIISFNWDNNMVDILGCLQTDCLDRQVCLVTSYRAPTEDEKEYNVIIYVKSEGHTTLHLHDVAAEDGLLETMFHCYDATAKMREDTNLEFGWMWIHYEIEGKKFEFFHDTEIKEGGFAWKP